MPRYLAETEAGSGDADMYYFLCTYFGIILFFTSFLEVWPDTMTSCKSDWHLLARHLLWMLLVVSAQKRHLSYPNNFANKMTWILDEHRKG
jgi:hypothetical protein